MRRIASVSCHSVTVEHGTSWLFVDVMWQDAGPTYERFRVHIEDCERIEPRERADEAAQRHERLWIQHYEAYRELTGKEPRERQQWDSYAVFAAGFRAGWRDRSTYSNLAQPAGADVGRLASNVYHAEANALGLTPEAPPVQQPTLTPAEWRALGTLEKILGCIDLRRQIVAHVLSPEERDLIASAIDKLRGDKLLALQGER